MYHLCHLDYVWSHSDWCSFKENHKPNRLQRFNKIWNQIKPLDQWNQTIVCGSVSTYWYLLNSSFLQILAPMGSFKYKQFYTTTDQESDTIHQNSSHATPNRLHQYVPIHTNTQGRLIARFLMFLDQTSHKIAETELVRTGVSLVTELFPCLFLPDQ